MKASAPLNKTVSLILLLIIILLVSGWMVIVGSTTKEKVIENSCRFSIALSSVGSGVGAQLINPFELYCPRTLLVVGEEKIRWANLHVLQGMSDFINYKYDAHDPKEPGKLEYKTNVGFESDAQLEQETRELFTYEMTKCWETFQSGDRNILESESNIWQEATCIVCSEIIYDKDNSFNPFMLEIDDYLQNTNHTLRNVPDMSASSYLYSFQHPSYSQVCKSTWEQEYYDEPIRIENGGQYAVIFYRLGSRWQPLLDSAGIRESTSCQAVGVIPADQAFVHCTPLIN